MALVAFLYAHEAIAQNFTVTSTTDAVDAVPGDGNCDDGSGNCTLRAAIQESNALGATHVITLPAGTYTLTLAGTNENASATGDLDVSANITINGASAQTTFIDGGGIDRVLHVQSGATLNTINTSVTGGFISQNNGGGILNEGTLTLTRSEIQGNTADLADETLGIWGGFGGGIANSGTLTMNTVTIRGNDATGSEGPRGITGGGGGGSTPGFGGGIYNESGATVTATNCTISGNRAMGGRASRGSPNGGVWNAAGSTGGNMAAGAGGAAGGGAGGNATGDYSGGGGGGSMSSGGGSGGSGGYGAGGGAVGARTSGGSSTNPVGAGGFGGGSGNNACCSSSGGGGAGAGFGGGIFNNGGTVTLTNVTIAFNEALGGNGRTSTGGWAGRGLQGSGFGGGVFNRSGTVEMNNTLLSNNNGNVLNGSYVAAATTYEDLWGTFTSTTGYNLVFTPGGSATIGGVTTGNVTGQDPILEPIALNGGQTFTHSTLDCASPIIDAGLDAVAPAVDQTGAIRIDVNGGANISDIGAFEGPDCSVLPVALVDFSIQHQSCTISLEWTTATEVNNDYFLMERSYDMNQWIEIEKVEGSVHSLELKNYALRDATVDKQGTVYYRLTQVDIDGKKTNYGIRSVEYSCNLLIAPEAYPNPVQDVFVIESTQSGWLQLISMNGKTVHSQRLDTGENMIHIENLAPGTYTMFYQMDSDQTFREKLVKL